MSALLLMTTLIVAVPDSALPPVDGAASPTAARRPNIIVVMADDMRVDDLRFAPNLRRLVARRGLTFRNSFSPFPLCCPARASFLTGLYAHRHHVWSHARPWGYRAFDDSRTLATSLRRSGYRTGFVGKYLNGYGPHRSKVSGKPSWGYVPRGWTDWRAAIDPVRGRFHGGTYNYWDTPYNVNGRVETRYNGRYQTGVIGGFSAAMARRFSRRPAPFFMYVNFVAPHHGGPGEVDDPRPVVDRRGHRRGFMTPARPRWVRGRFDDLITRSTGLPRNGGPSERNISDKPPNFRARPEPNAAERRAMRAVTRQRAEAVYVMDREVGRLVRALKRAREWRSTVFMFTSDNGYYLGEHRKRQGKVSGHEPSLRVPFLVTGPGMRGGGRNGRLRYDPITTVDVTATILDLADAQPPFAGDGTSRVATMRRGDRGWTVPVLHETVHTGGKKRGGFTDARTSIGVRTARYSMLIHRNGAELYDLMQDPLQNRSVWRSAEYRPIRRALRQVWWALKDCVGPECRAELPDTFMADPAQTRKMTSAYWRSVNRAYGW